MSKSQKDEIPTPDDCLVQIVIEGYHCKILPKGSFFKCVPPYEFMTVALKHKPDLRMQVLLELRLCNDIDLAVPYTPEKAGKILREHVEANFRHCADFPLKSAPHEMLVSVVQETLALVAPAHLWNCLINNPFWNDNLQRDQEKAAADYDKRVRYMTYILELMCLNNLVKLEQLLKMSEFEKFLDKIPDNVLKDYAKRILPLAAREILIDREDIAGAFPLIEVVRSIPLQHIWDKAVLPLAYQHGFQRNHSIPPPVPPSRRSAPIPAPSRTPSESRRQSAQLLHGLGSKERDQDLLPFPMPPPDSEPVRPRAFRRRPLVLAGITFLSVSAFTYYQLAHKHSDQDMKQAPGAAPIIPLVHASAVSPPDPQAIPVAPLAPVSQHTGPSPRLTSTPTNQVRSVVSAAASRIKPRPTGPVRQPPLVEEPTEEPGEATYEQPPVVETRSGEVAPPSDP